jgi:hypothetical protein
VKVIFQGVKKPRYQSFKPIVNCTHPWKKPLSGGLWTSPPHPTNESHWVDWCVSEKFGGPPFTLWDLETIDNPNLAVVDTVADLNDLHKRFGVGDRYTTGLDFEAMAREYDGMHLTEEGQWRTRHSQPHDLYGWDCETVLWFRWAIVSVNGPRFLVGDKETEDA